MRRRTFLVGVPTMLALGVATSNRFAFAQASLQTANFEALHAYCGVYRISGEHVIGINRFITDSGEGVLFFADYRTSLVRPLVNKSDDVFGMGPASGGRTPEELILQFHRDRQGHIRTLSLHYAGGDQAIGERTTARDEDVSFTQDNVTLSGTLTLPEGAGPYPAIILLHGSGPLTRHSFGPYPRFFNSLGMAVLTFDKRGTGASTGRRLDASTGASEILSPAFYPTDLAADAQAAFAFLKGRPEIDASRIGFWGSSEGGMLSTHVAARSSEIAFVINSSGFMGPLWETILYQGDARLRVQGAAESEIDDARAFNELWMRVARTGAGYEEFLRRRQTLIEAGKRTWLYYYSREYKSLDQMRWSWDHILFFDSFPALQHVTCPALGLFGQADILVDPERAASGMRMGLMAGGNKNIRTEIVPNATHSLMAVSRIGMAPGVFNTLASWFATYH